MEPVSLNGQDTRRERNLDLAGVAAIGGGLYAKHKAPSAINKKDLSHLVDRVVERPGFRERRLIKKLVRYGKKKGLQFHNYSGVLTSYLPGTGSVLVGEQGHRAETLARDLGQYLNASGKSGVLKSLLAGTGHPVVSFGLRAAPLYIGLKRGMDSDSSASGTAALGALAGAVPGALSLARDRSAFHTGQKLLTELGAKGLGKKELGRLASITTKAHIPAILGGSALGLGLGLMGHAYMSRLNRNPKYDHERRKQVPGRVLGLGAALGGAIGLGAQAALRRKFKVPIKATSAILPALGLVGGSYYALRPHHKAAAYLLGR